MTPAKHSKERDMHVKAIKFKDTWAAPGSQLHAALEDKDFELAKKIYDQCEEDARKLLEKGDEMSKTPTEELSSREQRLGASVMDFARKAGWQDDGEGAFEYIQRISYAQGLEDGAAKPDDIEPVEPVVPVAKITAADEYGPIIEWSKHWVHLIGASLFVRPAPKLAVWYGPMPESNGKTNWTAILHNGDFATGITLDRSEYPDRVRYEADRARWLIGEMVEEPLILDYDAEKRSDYVAPPAPLDVIKDAIRDYHYALDTRQHGGVAQDRAFNAICKALDMHWQQGLEKARREPTQGEVRLGI
jgi:hypothetical protein